jgi:excisionase family DNA binding protein
MAKPKVRDGDLLTFTDAGRVMGVSREWIRKLVGSGRVPTVRTAGGVHLLWRVDVEAATAARAKAMKSKAHVRSATP